MTADTGTAIAEALAEIVGSDGVQGPTPTEPFAEIDPALHAALAQAVVPDGDRVRCVAYPRTQTQLGRAIALAAQRHWRVLPCGAGSKLAWGGQAAGIDVAISTQRLRATIEHAVGDLTVTVEAGMPFRDLQARLAAAGQCLAIDPAYGERATVGGIVATGDSGSLRHRYNSVRDMCIGITFVRADGELVKAGGRVVKNVAGYDLMKLLTGSYGTLGAIAQVTFRLHPLPEASRMVVLLGGAERLAPLRAALVASDLTPTCVDLLSPGLCDRLGWGDRAAIAARFDGLAASVNDQLDRAIAWGHEAGLQAIADAAPWESLESASRPEGATVLCKLGVLPARAIAAMEKIHALFPESRLRVGAGNGLGTLCLTSTCERQHIAQFRAIATSCGGFLTVLEAPVSLKQQVDVWGYAGNALPVMRRLKREFDPNGILASGRFVGGI